MNVLLDLTRIIADAYEQVYGSDERELLQAWHERNSEEHQVVCVKLARALADPGDLPAYHHFPEPYHPDPRRPIVDRDVLLHATGWIPLADRQPKDKQYCLIYSKHPGFALHTFQAVYYADLHVRYPELNGPGFVAIDYVEIYPNARHEITHWMPLPDPPEEA